MKRIGLKTGLTLLGVFALATAALAQAGLFANWPIAGGASYCSSYTNGVCSSTVPAGPALNGLETVPADTHAAAGQMPQQVLVQTSAFATIMSQQTPLTGFSIVVPNGTTLLDLTPAGTLATGTITFPSNPVNNQRLDIFDSQIQTALTLTAPAGQTIIGGVTTEAAADWNLSFVYQASNSTWYRAR